MNASIPAWAASPAGGIAVMAVGCMLGFLLVQSVDTWFRATDERPVSRRTAVLMVCGSAVAALLLWWWEIRQAGQILAAGGPGAGAIARGDLWPRTLAHLVLFCLLAAATWIDFRQRVIPDWITLPGVLLGLAAVASLPDVLLPIMVEVPRSFAAPALQPDVLAWYGGLRTGSSGALGPAPDVAGLCAAAAVFAVWWAVCTEPMDGIAAFRLAQRVVLLGLGLLAIATTWWTGGGRFDGLQSGLVGLAVSGGLVWAIRAGASRALGREAMGFGDVTLMAMVGAWLGWQACVLTFFLAAFIGLAHGLVQVLLHRENELPFGPSLCLAAGVVVVAWRPLWQAASVHFEQPAQLGLVVATVVVLTAATLFLWRRLRRMG